MVLGLVLLLVECKFLLGLLVQEQLAPILHPIGSVLPELQVRELQVPELQGPELQVPELQVPKLLVVVRKYFVVLTVPT